MMILKIGPRSRRSQHGGHFFESRIEALPLVESGHLTHDNYPLDVNYPKTNMVSMDFFKHGGQNLKTRLKLTFSNFENS
jgi:hypothetical protein